MISLPEQDKELDLFSEESLKIAEALRIKYPNTWKLLYDNRVMPEVIAFITADMKRVALEARLDELRRNKTMWYYTSDEKEIEEAFNGRIAELTKE